MATEAPAAGMDLVMRTEARRQEASSVLGAARRARLGQYFTPAPVADFIASLVCTDALDTKNELHILDPGAGVGSLTASLVTRVLRHRPGMKITVTACEVDPLLHASLQATLDDCARTARAVGGEVEVHLVGRDFITWATEEEGLFGRTRGPFDLVIMNPPYKKLAANSRERKAVTAACTETSNLYSAFLALGIRLLSPGGQLLAITPRSFTNGLYFRPFRKYLLKRMEINHLHVFESRNAVFADANVLQENVIFSATRVESADRGAVTVSTSRSHAGGIRSRTIRYEDMVHPADPESFLHIGIGEEDTELAVVHAGLPSALSGIGCQVSTGRVVDFRSKEHLRPDPVAGAVPLIYPLHMREGGIIWPVPEARKSNAIMLNEETRKMTFPSGYYVVVKRLSSKEERRRVVAAVFDPEETPCERIGFENHVNVFHRNGGGIMRDTARGLCLWLNSSLLDRFIRRFSGHTQVNATDLRNLRYPSSSQLEALGREWEPGVLSDQAKIDDLVGRHVARGGEGRSGPPPMSSGLPVE
ncbi:Eco57I restriction-modification methylase domain-containing protein [Streptomyces aidingensis]|uniref:site-specific DNA-methyltransferase (adenine-specific) n=1 Tax=Streptomyces aidingensis TaxID=910347 RepID=A0A1I1R6I1_9ACTN|nr:Eco57I restriction-modification methylase domain-containing protein [Streptomyces aidingensis]SFD27768.1 adenine-specific DNA-methyltransferase [Streptomyces aidingensis]